MNSSSDGFHFIYKSWAENGTLTARIDALDGAGDSARAGIMARADGGARLPFTFVGPREDGNLAFTRRTHGGEQRVEITVAEVNVPFWVRLNLHHDHVEAEYSLNGFTWQRAGRQTIDLSDTPRTGLAASSQINKAKCRAIFTNVSFAAHAAG
jgi:regulation of enolase protein 1 (concanavalin A-like superfamily)